MSKFRYFLYKIIIELIVTQQLGDSWTREFLWRPQRTFTNGWKLSKNDHMAGGWIMRPIVRRRDKEIEMVCVDFCVTESRHGGFKFNLWWVHINDHPRKHTGRQHTITLTDKPFVNQDWSFLLKGRCRYIRIIFYLMKKRVSAVDGSRTRRRSFSRIFSYLRAENLLTANSFRHDILKRKKGNKSKP